MVVQCVGKALHAKQHLTKSRAFHVKIKGVLTNSRPLSGKAQGLIGTGLNKQAASGFSHTHTHRSFQNKKAFAQCKHSSSVASGVNTPAGIW